MTKMFLLYEYICVNVLTGRKNILKSENHEGLKNEVNLLKIDLNIHQILLWGISR